MGDVIKWVQTVTANGGALEFLYTHDPKGKASRVGLIAFSIRSGTQTGASCISYGNDPLNVVCLNHHSHTASDYSNVVEPDIVIQPGQVIKISASSVTAGDVVVAMVEGH